MHRGLLVATLLLIAPCAAAQVQFHGALGIYDDPAHTQAYGNLSPLAFKTIYVGLDLDTLDKLLEGLEFSIAGLEPVFILGMVVQPPPAVVIGDVRAPIDMQNGVGGLNIAWSSYTLDSDISIALQIVSAAPPTDHEFQVLRRFPPSWPDLPHPLALHDVGIIFLRLPLVGGAYTLNPTIAVESRTWSAVKSLFRSP